MDVKEIVDLFSGPDGEQEARQYLLLHDLLDVLSQKSQQVEGRIPYDYCDLARLHALIRARKVFTVLEFGVGYSTTVMADALKTNNQDWESLSSKPRLRNSTPFQLHSVDSAPTWIEVVKNNLPEAVRGIVTIHHSGVTAGTFNGRACHFYDRLPDVVPDFIYLDGPDPADVRGKSGGGISWQNPDRVVLAGDLLRIEPWLLPGTCIVIDGRTANLRFLAAHLYRKWEIMCDPKGEVSVLELQESPLGAINRETMLYCLGERVLDWPEPAGL